jgi:hypothetical protein
MWKVDSEINGLIIRQLKLDLLVIRSFALSTIENSAEGGAIQNAEQTLEVITKWLERIQHE